MKYELFKKLKQGDRIEFLLLKKRLEEKSSMITFYFYWYMIILLFFTIILAVLFYIAFNSVQLFYVLAILRYPLFLTGVIVLIVDIITCVLYYKRKKALEEEFLKRLL